MYMPAILEQHLRTINEMTRRIAELESQIAELQRDMEYRDGYLTKLEQRAALLEEECDALRQYREDVQNHFLNMGW